jgi:hypothetical protein
LKKSLGHNFDNIEIQALTVKELLKNQNQTDYSQTSKTEQKHL